MNKKFILKKNEDIQYIINNGKKIVNKYFIIYYHQNNIKINRYCISVSKKIGKAHTRNLYKRRIKDILQKNNFNNSLDYVIILRKSILSIDYSKMSFELQYILKGK